MVEKKIIIIGSNHEAALELVFKKVLDKNGYLTIIFPAQTIFLQYYYSSIWNKIMFRLGFSNIIAMIQTMLKRFIILENPKIAIVFKGMEVEPSTLKWMKNRGILISNYNPDHPFIFSGRGSGNKRVSESILLFDHYFSYAADVIDKLSKFGVHCSQIPFGFDSDGFEYSPLDRGKEIVKCCFLGNADKFRVEFLNGLSKLGLEIDVYGENWQQFGLDSLINIFPAKYGFEFWETLQKYAVQFNLLRPHNLNTHNMRSFDIPGAGGIMLAPVTSDHTLYFENDIEIFLFDGLETAFLKANKILSLSFEERMIIRQNARERAIQFHSYTNRVLQMMNYLSKV